MWEVRIQHEGLRASRTLKGATQADAQWRADVQLALWQDRWSAQQRMLSARAACDTRQMLALHGPAIAAARNAQLAAERDEIGSLLASSLQRARLLCWDDLKDRSSFAGSPLLPAPPRIPAPQLVAHLYAPRLKLCDRLLPFRRRRKQREAAQVYAHELVAWRAACARRNLKAASDFRQQLERRRSERASHSVAQAAQHAGVEAARLAFERHDKDAVEYFFAEVLSRSCYPATFPHSASLHYILPTRTLFIDYELPALTAWPKIHSLQYMPGRNVLRTTPNANSWKQRTYEEALPQIALRVLSELFAHDDARAIDTIAFNGWVHALDASTGNMVRTCLCSVRVAGKAFRALNLAQVDPRACLSRLGATISLKPAELLPVEPATPHAGAHPTSVLLHSMRGQAEAVNVASLSRSDVDAMVREALDREFSRRSGLLAVAPAVRSRQDDARA